MTKLIALTLCALSLAACSNMTNGWGSGNPSETRNSSDANRSRNTSAVSPAGGAGTGASGASAGTSSGTSSGAGAK
jgi:hypothetical protein